jgi:hypothetical protein
MKKDEKNAREGDRYLRKGVRSRKPGTQRIRKTIGSHGCTMAITNRNTKYAIRRICDFPHFILYPQYYLYIFLSFSDGISRLGY